MNENQRQRKQSARVKTSRVPSERKRESIEQIRRRHEKKQRQKKVRRRVITTVIVMILLAVALLCVVFLTPMFLISHVNVDGNQKVDNQAIITQAAINLGENTFSVNLSQIEKRVESIPYIQKADIYRKLPKNIEIHVTERKIACYLKNNNQYYALDKQGRLLEMPETPDAHYLIVEGIPITSSKIGQDVVFGKPAQFKALRILLDQFTAKKVTGYVSKMNLTDPDNITFTYNNQFFVNFGGTEQASRKIDYIVTVSKSEQRAGSLRFDMDDGKIYFTAD